jgi:hypothetical protein
MSPETRIAIQLAFWSAAFWVGLAGFHRHAGARALPRQAAALVLGALAACAGGRLLHPGTAAAGPSVLFVPLGVLLLAPVRAGERRAFLPAGLAALPAGLAVARLGCLAGGCCGAPAAPALGAAALLALAALAARQPEACMAPMVLAGLAAVRAASEPLRPAAVSGPALLSPAVLATAWIFAAAAPWVRAGGPRPAQSRIRHVRKRVEGCRGFDSGNRTGRAGGRDVSAAAAVGAAGGDRGVPGAGPRTPAGRPLRRGG